MKQSKSLFLAMILILGISGILLRLFSLHTAISFLLGSAISLIPITLFAKIFFQSTSASKKRTPKNILNTFYMAELLKIILSIILFMCVFQWKELQALALFLGFITAQLGYLFTRWMYNEKPFFP